MIRLQQCFVTGCDNATAWMLPWFLSNYRRHNDTPIVFCDFGVDEATLKWAETRFDEVVYNDAFERDSQTIRGPRWWLKPLAMIEVKADAAMWIDTDCEVLGDLSGAFKLLVPNKINIVKDLPWSSRRGETWFNTGVFGIIDKPRPLFDWWMQCKVMTSGFSINQVPRGDQDALKELLQNDPMTIWSNINELPNKYNWLRIQLLDGQDSKDKLLVHWTGPKGKDIIRKKING